MINKNRHHEIMEDAVSSIGSSGQIKESFESQKALCVLFASGNEALADTSFQFSE